MSCRRVFTWIANLLIWGAIALVIVAFLGDSSSLQSASIALLIICAIIYYCETFICSYCSSLSNITTAAKSYEDIDKMFKSSPLITMNIHCFHYARRRRYGAGRRRGMRSSERVITHRSSEEFPYQSWRDISGEFRLETSSAAKNDAVSYVLLDLALEVQFASDGTAEDYSRSKLDFVSRNRYDRYQSYFQRNDIPGFRERFLIQVTDNGPCCFGRGFFIFFGLLTFNAFYSTYVDCCCHRQKFTIKKAISTRQDLNAPKVQDQYAYYDPRMIMNNQMVVFNPAQGPQVYGLNQPGAQQYMNMQAVQPQVLFAPVVRGEELTETPESDCQPPGNQSTLTPLRGNGHQAVHPQYAVPPHYGIQQAPYQPQQLVAAPQVAPQPQIARINNV